MCPQELFARVTGKPPLRLRDQTLKMLIEPVSVCCHLHSERPSFYGWNRPLPLSSAPGLCLLRWPWLCLNHAARTALLVDPAKAPASHLEGLGLSGARYKPRPHPPATKTPPLGCQALDESWSAARPPSPCAGRPSLPPLAAASPGWIPGRPQRPADPQDPRPQHVSPPPRQLLALR